MTLNFSLAKNNEVTFSVDELYYHSKYNPSAEAQKWINQIDCNYIPEIIVILGCGLPYCVKFLKNKFPTSKIILIQYHEEIINKTKNLFSDDKKSFFQLNIDTYSSVENLSDFFFNTFSEEISNQILFLSWKPSEKIFKDKYTFAYNSIQLYLNKSKEIIATRRFFSKKWLSNIFRFFEFANNFYKIEKVNKDILIIASGPSLKNSIEKIKRHRTDFFLISVSSATKVLIHNDIIPDLIITTDGGYWAKKHLQFLEKLNLDIPIICSAEASLSFNLLKKNKIIPIEYNDFTNKYFFENFKLSTVKINRNGTVAGSALEIAKQLTEKNIYFIGLDLSVTKSYQHTQPNVLENFDSQFDNKFFNKEKRITTRNLTTSSLKTYRTWFENLSPEYTKNIFRIFTKNNFQSDLGNIKTLTWENVKFYDNKFTTKIIQQKNINKIDIKVFIKKILQNLQTENNLEKIFYTNLEWIKLISLGNILNYNKYKNFLFLENAINETKEFFINQLKKMEK